MRRTSITAAIALVLFAAVACKKTNQDAPPADEQAAIGDEVQAAVSEQPVEEPEVPEFDFAVECQELVRRATNETRIALRTIGVEIPEGFTETYGEEASTFEERCQSMSVEAMACTRANDSVLFGVLACGVNRGRAEELRMSFPRLTLFGDARRVVELDARQSASLTRSLEGDWEVGRETWQFTRAGDLTIVEGGSSQELKWEMEGANRIRFVGGDAVAWSATFWLQGDELWLSDNLNYGVFELPDEGADPKFVLRHGFDHLVVDLSGDEPVCEALHESGARIEAECIQAFEARGTELRVRYRFPSAHLRSSDGAVNDYTFVEKEGVMIDDEMRRLLRAD